MRSKGYLAVGIAALVLTAIEITGCAPSKEALKQTSEKVSKQVESQSYTFEATNMFPSRGTMITLTGNYTLKVSKDTIVSYLPFFGRAYKAPISSDDAGIKFTSTKFEYSAKPAPKGGWNIVIRTKDVPNEYLLNLYISSRGSCSLQVTSTYKEVINFSGYLKDL